MEDLIMNTGMKFIQLTNLRIEYGPCEAEAFYTGVDMVYPEDLWLIGQDKHGNIYQVTISAKVAQKLRRTNLSDQFVQKLDKACRSIRAVVIGIPDTPWTPIWVAPDFFEKLGNATKFSDRHVP
jgi:hypothetical protein